MSKWSDEWLRRWWRRRLQSARRGPASGGAWPSARPMRSSSRRRRRTRARAPASRSRPAGRTASGSRMPRPRAAAAVAATRRASGITTERMAVTLRKALRMESWRWRRRTRSWRGRRWRTRRSCSAPSASASSRSNTRWCGTCAGDTRATSGRSSVRSASWRSGARASWVDTAAITKVGPKRVKKRSWRRLTRLVGIGSGRGRGAQVQGLRQGVRDATRAPTALPQGARFHLPVQDVRRPVRRAVGVDQTHSPLPQRCARGPLP